MESAEMDSRRTCLACRRPFRPKRINQFYCSVKCRHKSKDRRKVERQRTVAMPPAGIELNNRILDVQTDRDKLGLPRLHRDAYLLARAEVIEAEQQMKVWTHRLNLRRAALSKLIEPPVSRRVVILNERKPLTVPDNAINYGACSTDGLLGVVVFGCTNESETKVESEEESSPP